MKLIHKESNNSKQSTENRLIFNLVKAEVVKEQKYETVLQSVIEKGFFVLFFFLNIDLVLP